MVYSHSDPAVIRVTMFSCSPAQWCAQAGQQHWGQRAAGMWQTLPWLGELHFLPFHDNFLQRSQLKFEHILEGVLELHHSLCPQACCLCDLGASLEARMRAAFSSQWIYAQCTLALVRCFAQCQDSYEQAGKGVGDWRWKGGLWTHWSRAVLFDQEQKASLGPACFPCPVPCTRTSTCKMRVSSQLLVFCVLSSLHLPWQTSCLHIPLPVTQPASMERESRLGALTCSTEWLKAGCPLSSVMDLTRDWD